MVFNGLPIILLRFAVCAVVALQHGTSHAQQYPTWTMDPNPQLGGKKEKGMLALYGWILAQAINNCTFLTIRFTC